MRLTNPVDSDDAIMMVLGVREDILGSTWFARHLFLADEGRIFDFDKNGMLIRWKSHIYGPYWDGFDAAIRELEAKGLLKTEEQSSASGHTATKFSITVRGRARFNELASEHPDRIKRLVDLMRDHQKKSLPELLEFVCEQYPEYTGNGRIKEQMLRS